MNLLFSVFIYLFCSIFSSNSVNFSFSFVVVFVQLYYFQIIVFMYLFPHESPIPNLLSPSFINLSSVFLCSISNYCLVFRLWILILNGTFSKHDPVICMFFLCAKITLFQIYSFAFFSYYLFFISTRSTCKWNLLSSSLSFCLYTFVYILFLFAYVFSSLFTKLQLLFSIYCYNSTKCTTLVNLSKHVFVKSHLIWN